MLSLIIIPSTSLSLKSLLLFLIQIFGLFVSILILRHENGILDTFTERVCHAGKKVNCAEVLNSNKLKIKNVNFSLGDLSFVFFSGNILNWIAFSNFNRLSLPILYSFYALISPITLLLSIYSIYYQYSKIKKWCLLCLVISMILWIQASIIIPYLNISTLRYNNCNSIFIFFVCYSLMLLGFVWIKQFWVSTIKLKTNLIKAMRFRKNPKLFISALQYMPLEKIQISNSEIVYGSNDNYLKITIIISLFCNPCTEVNSIVESIIKSQANNLCIAYKILPPPKKEEDSFRYILSYIESIPQKTVELLSFWFSEKQIDSLKKRYPIKMIPENSINQKIKELDMLQQRIKITYTPTIFINERRLPPMYDYTDLPYFIPDLVDFFKSEKD